MVLRVFFLKMFLVLLLLELARHSINFALFIILPPYFILFFKSYQYDVQLCFCVFIVVTIECCSKTSCLGFACFFGLYFHVD